MLKGFFALGLYLGIASSSIAGTQMTQTGVKFPDGSEQTTAGLPRSSVYGSTGMEGATRISYPLNNNWNSSMPSGFYQDHNAANAPRDSWINLMNVRHSNTNNDHGFQLAMSYYDNDLWYRSYSGGTGKNDGNFREWKKAGDGLPRSSVYGSLGMEGATRISYPLNNNWNSSMPSGFYQSHNAANAPRDSWINLMNVRHSNTNNDHGFQLAMSYYDNDLWYRSYSGGTGKDDGSFREWKKAGGGSSLPAKSMDVFSVAGTYTWDWEAAGKPNVVYVSMIGGGASGDGNSGDFGDGVSGVNGSWGLNVNRQKISVTGGVTVTVGAGGAATARYYRSNPGTRSSFGSESVAGGTGVGVFKPDSFYSIIQGGKGGDYHWSGGRRGEDGEVIIQW